MPKKKQKAATDHWEGFGVEELQKKPMYYLLIVVSSPMICMQVRGISLFLWAVLLIVSHRELKKK